MGKGQSSTRLSTEHRPYDLNTIMGDFSAKIGSDNSGYEDTIGTQALGEKKRQLLYVSSRVCRSPT